MDKDVEELRQQVLDVLRARMDTARKYVEGVVRASTPRGKTGRLLKSVKSRYRETANSMRFQVRAGMYARFLEYGTRVKGSGKWRIRPRLWFERAFLSAMPQALNILQGK